jgi:hypothetical protein
MPDKDDENEYHEWKEDEDPFTNAKDWKEDTSAPNSIWDQGQAFGGSRDADKVPEKSRVVGGKPPPPQLGGKLGGQLGEQPGDPAKKPQSLLEYQQKFGVVTTCAILSTGELINGCIIGGVIGAFSGISEGYQQQIHKTPDFKYFLRGRVISNALSIGTSLAVWRGGACVAMGLRKKNDALNSMIGGFFAGVVMGLPSRNPRNMLVSGLSYSFIAGTFDALTKQY